MSGHSLGRRSTGTIGSVSKGEVFELLRNRRRRFVLHYLKRFRGPVSVRDLATQIAAWESGQPVDDVTRDQRRRVYTTLQQTHLDKMDAAGIIEYDADEKVVDRTQRTDELTLYLEVVPGREFPWQEYYLSLGAISCALVVALWANVFPFTLLPDIAWASLIAITVTLSAVYHTYSAEQLRLGERDAPPEVADER
ncbi:MAG: hypothetical protein ABEI96_00010 [Haloarculaceae archaeon]